LVENVHLRRRIESTAVARERRRLARDLHDSVTQSLHSLTFAAYTAGNRLRQGRLDQLDESLRQLSDGAAQALKEMRLLLFEMRLAPLETLDLVEALQIRLEAVEKRAGIDAALTIESDPLWPKDWEREIYCIAMEALNNSLKHAHARQVRVRLGIQADHFLLEVADNGQGFDASKSDRSGMGLHNMAERVERLGGQLHIDAAPGSGTCIQVVCRLDPGMANPLEMLDEKEPYPDRR
jgi:signal transduction histidine kinase